MRSRVATSAASWAFKHSSLRWRMTRSSSECPVEGSELKAGSAKAQRQNRESARITRDHLCVVIYRLLNGLSRAEAVELVKRFRSSVGSNVQRSPSIPRRRAALNQRTGATLG